VGNRFSGEPLFLSRRSKTNGLALFFLLEPPIFYLIRLIPVLPVLRLFVFASVDELHPVFELNT
jgi:hypothetical protein